jgi:hypothetical protein
MDAVVGGWVVNVVVEREVVEDGLLAAPDGSEAGINGPVP